MYSIRRFVMEFRTDHEFYYVCVYTNDDDEMLILEKIVCYVADDDCISREQFFKNVADDLSEYGGVLEISRLVVAEQPCYSRVYKRS